MRECFGRILGAAALSAALLSSASAENIAVSNYGIAANAMPYAVALEKKFYQAHGANVTGIISSQGGGTSIRNMLAGGVSYAEANPGATAVKLYAPVPAATATVCSAEPVQVAPLRAVSLTCTVGPVPQVSPPSRLEFAFASR